MSVGSQAVLVPDDADAISYYRQVDVNDQVCAIIKVVPDQSLSGRLIMQTKGGMAPVAPPRGLSNYREESGEWWFWVSPKVTNILFTCEGYTATDWIGVALSPGKVYRLELCVEASYTLVKTSPKLTSSGIKLTVTPPAARVSYGNSGSQIINSKQITDGSFDVILVKGTYFFKIESDYYESYAKEVTIDNGIKELTVNLVPAFGSLRLNTNPQGATVFIDGKEVGTTPIEQTSKISKGKHDILFQKDNYYVSTKEVKIIGDGSLQVIPKVDLKPQFGTVTLFCEDKTADLVITNPAGDEVFRGRDGSSIILNSQSLYKLESVKPSHLSQSTLIHGDEIEGKSLDIHIDSPVPLYGELVISSEPSRASVYFDGTYVGTTLLAKSFLVGEHTIELKKDGYIPLQFTVKILQDQTLNLSHKMEELPNTWVDLGLPSGTKWATCNVGASKPEDEGYYFAWGDTRIQDDDDYLWKNEDGYTKYNADTTRGIVDNLVALEKCDDAATLYLGDQWRMPSIDELIELKTICRWKWVRNGGRKGYIVTGPNGNSIYLPAAGLRANQKVSYIEVPNGYYWSRSLYQKGSGLAGLLWFNSNGVNASVDAREAKASIRPVLNEDSNQSTLSSHDFPEIDLSDCHIRASFMGGDANVFSRWVNERLVYPEIAKENGVQGKVSTRFTIEADGRLTNVEVVRGVDPAIDAEAVRVISSSPAWKPASVNGRYVRITYTFPVFFLLR